MTSPVSPNSTNYIGGLPETSCLGSTSDLLYGKTVSWGMLADMVRISKSNRHYMLGCESSKITELTMQSGKAIVSFDGKIEPILGALFISAALTKSVGLFGKFLNRLNQVMKNPNAYSRLYFSMNEVVYHAPSIVTGVAGVVFALTLAGVGELVNNIRFFAASVWIFSQATKDMQVFLEGIYQQDAYKVLRVILAVGKFIYNVILKAIGALPWWNRAKATAYAAADNAAIAATPYITALTLVYSLYGLWLSINAALKDINDPDPYITSV
ncbi:MAG: hypothetical protein D6732_02045 [Methanobacteriota archaeon]|nr:MAG: hypothetical protein D6732_02045 [Euryarchaeota archaeon]